MSSTYTYLDELEALSREGKEMLKEIIRDLPAHPERLATLSIFLRFQQLEARREK